MVRVTRGVQYSTHCRALVIALAVGVYTIASIQPTSLKLEIDLQLYLYYSKHTADLTENGSSVTPPETRDRSTADLTENGSTVTPPETLSRGKGKDGWLQSFSHGS